MTVAPYEVGYQEFVIFRGLPWSCKVNIADVIGAVTTTRNLTSATVAFTVRAANDDAATALVQLTQAAGITRASTDPNLTMAITDAATTALAANEHAWAWLVVSDVPILAGPCRIKEWGAQ